MSPLAIFLSIIWIFLLSSVKEALVHSSVDAPWGQSTPPPISFNLLKENFPKISQGLITVLETPCNLTFQPPSLLEELKYPNLFHFLEAIKIITAKLFICQYPKPQSAFCNEEQYSTWINYTRVAEASISRLIKIAPSSFLQTTSEVWYAKSDYNEMAIQRAKKVQINIHDIEGVFETFIKTTDDLYYELSKNQEIELSEINFSIAVEPQSCENVIRNAQNIDIQSEYNIPDEFTKEDRVSVLANTLFILIENTTAAMTYNKACMHRLNEIHRSISVKKDLVPTAPCMSRAFLLSIATKVQLIHKPTASECFQMMTILRQVPIPQTVGTSVHLTVVKNEWLAINEREHTFLPMKNETKNNCTLQGSAVSKNNPQRINMGPCVLVNVLNGTGKCKSLHIKKYTPSIYVVGDQLLYSVLNRTRVTFKCPKGKDIIRFVEGEGKLSFDLRCTVPEAKLLSQGIRKDNIIENNIRNLDRYDPSYKARPYEFEIYIGIALIIFILLMYVTRSNIKQAIKWIQTKCQHNTVAPTVFYEVDPTLQI